MLPRLQRLQKKGRARRQSGGTGFAPQEAPPPLLAGAPARPAEPAGSCQDRLQPVNATKASDNLLEVIRELLLPSLVQLQLLILLLKPLLKLSYGGLASFA